jgi:hypothetical protein
MLVGRNWATVSSSEMLFRDVQPKEAPGVMRQVERPEKLAEIISSLWRMGNGVRDRESPERASADTLAPQAETTPSEKSSRCSRRHVANV